MLAEVAGEVERCPCTELRTAHKNADATPPGKLNKRQ